MKLRDWLPAAVGAAIVIALVGLLEIAGRAGWVSPYLVPPPSEIAEASWRLAQEEPLAAAVFTTLLVSLAATLASALIGIPAGWLMYRYPAHGIAYEAWAGAMFSAPLILLYPLFLVLFGRNLHTIAIIGFISGVVTVLLKTYEGLARVISSIAELPSIQEGEVLVTRSTGPTFNVVRPLLGAIVTERGGALSHAAIVAREYGLPAVVGCAGATSAIGTGTRIRVDGGKGEVWILA